MFLGICLFLSNEVVRVVTVLVCELITIGALLAFTAAEWFSISRSKELLDKAENELW